MRRSRKLAATALAGTLLATAFGVAGASAEDTTVTFEVAANTAGLTIDVAGTAPAATLTSSGTAVGFSLTDGSVSGSLPATTVTDARGTLAGTWAVTVAGTDFANGANASVIVADENARAYLNATDLTALTTSLSGSLTGMTIVSAELTAGVNNLGTDYTLVSGTTALGNGSVTYTPAMDVTVPASTPAGTYTATVSQTVS